MDFIDLSPASEENCLKASKSMPVPLLPSVENFEGRLSISGDPFEKMLSQADLHNDPFECLMKSRSASGNSLTNNVGDLENFLQSPMFFGNSRNSAFLFCDLSPILNSPNPEQVSLLNNAFLQTSTLSGKNFSDADAEKIVEAFRKRIGSEPVATHMREDERKSKSMIQNEKEAAKESEWHSFVSEVQEDLLAETPPPMVFENEEDSIEELKIPALEQIIAEEKTLSGVENFSSSPDGATTINESVVDSSVVIDDLRRRMKDVLNRRITPSKILLDVTDTTLDVPRIVRQETFNIEKEPTGGSADADGEKKESQEEIKENEDPSGDTFMEKLKTMCGEHNVSFVQDASQAQKNQSMIVVYVNDPSNIAKPLPSPLRRRNSFSSEIPRVATPPHVSANRRRRSQTSTVHPVEDLTESREWKCPVGRVLPSPQFRGQQLKIRTGGEIKPRATVGPMRAIYPQPKIQVDENDTPPMRVTAKKRYSMTTSTPKVENAKPKACSTPLVKMSEKKASKTPYKRHSKHLLVENNKIRSSK